MRSKLYRAAVFLAIVSLLPLLIFLSRRESPPSKVEVKVHQKQTIENFVLRASDRYDWELKSPEAQAVDKNTLLLKEPVLTLYLKESIVIRAKEALYDRARREIELLSPQLLTGNYTAFSPKGIYWIEEKLFVSNSPCKFVSRWQEETVGRNCTVNFVKGTVIIKGGVKTTLTGVRR
jgi:hypothetical protein